MREEMPFPTIDVIDPTKASAGELIAWLAQKLGWDVSVEAAEFIVPSILADSRNLTAGTVTADTVQTVADMVRKGVNLHLLNLRYRQYSMMEPEILALKGRLIERVEYFDEGRIAVVVVTPVELEQYAELHDPADLVVYELINTRDVLIGAVLRNYGKKIKVTMRANTPVAAKAAQHFGGGGHELAAAFRTDDRASDDVKTELVDVLTKLIAENLAEEL
jgi:phosphoesterase RecJ-like protein